MIPRKIFNRVLVLATMLLPVVTYAQTSQGIQNPLNASFSSIPNFIAGVLKVMVQIGLPVIALAFLWSGFMFVKARGNSDALGKAKENFMWVCVGAVLILGAWVFATLIGNTVGQIIQGSPLN